MEHIVIFEQLQSGVNLLVLITTKRLGKLQNTFGSVFGFKAESMRSLLAIAYLVFSRLWTCLVISLIF